jgi:RNA ligase
MNYKFAYIETINDVLPHIDGMDEIRVFVKEDYTVINYMVAFEETFKWDESNPIGSSIRRECRGLVFDNETGALISHPYHKFFNVGEKEETQIHKINLKNPHVVLEKLDGSMIRPIPTEDGFRLATRAGITDVAMNAEVFIADKPQYANFIEKCFRKGTTPIFEWVSRKNRIVIDYPEDDLILTAIRYNEIGSYVTYKVMKNYASAWSIPVVKAIAGDETDLEKIVSHIRKWDDGEGVVIRFDSGHMYKIKADDYVLRHRSKEAINLEKYVIQTIVDDSVDDLIPLLTPEDAERLRQFEKEFWTSLGMVANEMDDLFNLGNTMYPNTKDFAVEFVQKKVLTAHVPIMYAMKAGNSAKQILVKQIKNLNTQTKIDKNRWLWGGLTWN